jgi:hypothetical protein
VGPKVVKFSSQVKEEYIEFEYELESQSSVSNWDWVGIYEKDYASTNRKYLGYAYQTT